MYIIPLGSLFIDTKKLSPICQAEFTLPVLLLLQSPDYQYRGRESLFVSLGLLADIPSKLTAHAVVELSETGKLEEVWRLTHNEAKQGRRKCRDRLWAIWHTQN